MKKNTHPIKTIKLFCLMLLLCTLNAQAQSPLFAPGMTITHMSSSSSPVGQTVDKLIDNDINTKYFDPRMSPFFHIQEFYIDANCLSIATRFTLTTANNNPGDDPTFIGIAGSNDETNWTDIYSTSITCTSTRFFVHDFSWTNSTAYKYYKIFLMDACSSSDAFGIQIAELQLYGSLLGINVKGNGNTISKGSTSPSTANFTDFGTLSNCTAPSITRTYTIENTSATALNISSITSSNVDFSISAVPSSINPGASATFNVSFLPSVAGTKSATIYVNSNSCSNAAYDFLVQGTKTARTTDLVRGSAVDFDGTDDHLTISNGSALPIGNSHYTLEAWFKADAMGEKGIIGWGNYGAANQVNALRLSSTGIVNYWWANDLVVNTGNITGQWHHIAATYNGTVRKIYLDGKVIAEDYPVGLNIPNTNNFAVGRTFNSEYFDGQLDEVRVWNVARTEREIRENMHLSLQGCETGLKVYYQLNEGTGTTVADKTGGSTTGTLVNGPSWTSSSVNIGHDAANISKSQSLIIPMGASTQNFTTAGLLITVEENSVSEDYTITLQDFAPNTTNGVVATSIFNNRTWTINKKSAASTQRLHLNFSFPANTFNNLDPSKYRLYWRPMNGSGDWTLLKNASTVTSNSIQFNNIREVGQFMVARSSEAQVSEVRGKAYSFDGVDDYIEVPYHASLNPASNFTAEAWAKVTGGQGTWRSVITSRNGTPSASGYIIYAGADNKWNFWVGDGSTWVMMASTIDVVLDQWVHVAMSCTGGTITAYINGIQVLNYSGYVANTAQPLRIGAGFTESIADYFFVGQIDEVRIWNSGRSQSQIRENMHLTLKGNEADLVSYYQFNKDIPLTTNGVLDALGLNHGTMTYMDASSYIESDVPVAGGIAQRINITGTGWVDFSTAGLNINFGTSPNGEIVVSRLQTEKPTGYNSIPDVDVDNEYFVVRNFGTNSSPNVNSLVFSNLSHIPAGTPTTDILLYRRASNAYGSTWGTAVTSASSIEASPNSLVTFSGSPLISGFSQLVTASKGNAIDLPIELMEFDARRIDVNYVNLKWSTASELNNKGFFVERMLEGETAFEAIDWVDGAGTSSSIKNYSFVDNNGFAKASYYRIRQVDFDETESFSEIRVVSNKTKQETNVVVSPNPVRNILNIRVGELPKSSQEAEIKVVDAQGRVVYFKNSPLISNQLFSIEDTQHWIPGIYFVQIIIDSEITVRKFIKE